MNKVVCPFCGNNEIQVGFKGTNVFGIGCIVLEKNAEYTVDMLTNDIKVSSKIICQKCNSQFSVQSNLENNLELGQLFLNLKISNLDTRFFLQVKNNELVPPNYSWETQIPPMQSVNYTKSADFYMHFLAPQDPKVSIENITPDIIYELMVFKASLGTFQIKKVLVPSNYNGDHLFTVDLDVNDGIRIVAYSLNRFLFENELISLEELLNNKIDNFEQKLQEAILVSERK